MVGTSDLQVALTRQFGPGAESSAQAARVVVDSSGNIYVAGTVSDAAILPSNDAGGSGGAYLRKYDSSGTEQWTRQFDGWITGLSADKHGDIYVAGDVIDRVIANPATSGRTRLAISEVVLRKYDSSGREMWTRQFGSSLENDHAKTTGLMSDQEGNVYVAVGQGNYQNPGEGGTAHLRKYDASGGRLWTLTIEAPGGVPAEASIRSVAVDLAGNVYIAGVVRNVVRGQVSEGKGDIFLRKYDASGADLWTLQFGSSNRDYLSSMTTDGEGNVLIAVWGDLETQGSYYSFRRKYDRSGRELWTIPQDASDRGGSVAVDNKGNIYHVNHSGALRRFNSSGRELWSAQFSFSDSEIDGVSDVQLDASGNIYVSGEVHYLPGKDPDVRQAFVLKITQRR